MAADALHLLYNVNFSIVSQVNPHIHLFHFSNRGAVGRPVSHRRGRGWRGGFFLSAAEQFCKIELIKWFRVRWRSLRRRRAVPLQRARLARLARC